MPYNFKMNKTLLNKQDIGSWLYQHKIQNYSINDDFSVDVDGDVILDKRELKFIPVKFNIVKKVFSCADNLLVDLTNCPKDVGETFYCYNNKLTSLQGCPERIGDHFDCGGNQALTSLDLGPQFVKRNILIGSNPIKNLDGFTTEFGWNFVHEVKNIACIEGFESLYNQRQKTQRL